jgi:hypothetical protein
MLHGHKKSIVIYFRNLCSAGTWYYMENDSCKEHTTTQSINKMNKNTSDIVRQDAKYFSRNKNRYSQ